MRPIRQESLSQLQVHAYRGWQRTTYSLRTGDQYEIRATGEWLYSPQVGFHGPQGSRYHSAPPFYPLPGIPGGALIGRVGESGLPFYVGAQASGEAAYPGELYLRIDDDRLGDNAGALAVEITVTRPQAPQPDTMPTSIPSR